MPLSRAVFLSLFQGWTQGIGFEIEEKELKTGPMHLADELGGPEGNAMRIFKPGLLERLPQGKVLRKRAK